jgi:20S proteasome alpha/beta subunit
MNDSDHFRLGPSLSFGVCRQPAGIWRCVRLQTRQSCPLDNHQESMAETSFALTGKGYVIVAADTTAARSIVKMKTDEDKIKTLGPHLLMAFSGEPGTTLYILHTNRIAL